jgi:hypothetical protein
LAKIVNGDLFLTAQIQGEGGHELQEEQQQQSWPANSTSGEWPTISMHFKKCAYRIEHFGHLYLFKKYYKKLHLFGKDKSFSKYSAKA